jgi:uncharacterized protein YbjT (DUF2867 family)
VRVLVTGATGFVGALAAGRLAADGHDVRVLVRDRQKPKAGELAAAGHELHEGDVLDADSLRGAGDGVEAAFYLVHSMGGEGDGDFAERDREAARIFGSAMREQGVARVLYLGGLGGDTPGSEHLRSRHETARALTEHGPPLTYFRAAMVIGTESASYRILRGLVKRLPVMIGPAWLRTRTQPVSIDDVLDAFAAALTHPDVEGEVELGGADVLTYQDLLDIMAEVLGRKPRPVLPVPFLSPSLSSHWIGFVTPVDTGVAQPLVEGLSTETVVSDPEPMRRLGLEPIGAREALQRAYDGEGGRRPPWTAASSAA